MDLTDRICLPIELEREIFDFALSSFPGCASRIILVARRFHDWYKHEVYRILIIAPTTIIPPTLYLFDDQHRRYLNQDYLETHGDRVRHVFFEECSSVAVWTILDYCPNVENLALRAVKGRNSPHDILPTLRDLCRRGKLKRLSLSLYYLFLYSNPLNFTLFASPAFSSVTHLTLSGWSRPGIDWSQMTDSNLPCLTHLALIVFRPPANTFIEHILGQSKQLRLLVLFDMAYRGTRPGNDLDLILATDLWLEDSRVVTLVRDDFPLGERSVCSSWERGVKGEGDFWSVAEGRQAKKIQTCDTLLAVLELRRLDY